MDLEGLGLVLDPDFGRDLYGVCVFSFGGIDEASIGFFHQLDHQFGTSLWDSVSSFDFWRKRSTSGAQNWSMTINGISVGSGSVSTGGANSGTITVGSPVSSQTGTITVVLSLSGATGTGTFRLEDNDGEFIEADVNKKFIMCYAMTIHKSQGDTIDGQVNIHEYGLVSDNKQLYYTAVSRGRELEKIKYFN